MNDDDLSLAFRIISANPSLAHFVGPRDEALILTAEEALGDHLPRQYREFVGKFGAGSFGAFEVYGLVDRDFVNSGIPDAVWLTLRHRRSSLLPSDLLIIGSAGDGDYYCLQLGQRENPVLIWPAGGSAQSHLEQLEDDFATYLLSGLTDEL